MSMLFDPIKLGNLQIKNRFVRSSTYERMGTETGEVTGELVETHRRLAKGEVGLIIPGYMYVHPLGRGDKGQIGIHNDRMIPGLKRLTEAVHQEDGKVAFQLVHVGRQTTKSNIGQTPLGPSSKGWDPTYFVKPKTMTEEQIQEAIQSFGDASRRALEAGADGIQIQAAHGYLINQFLSPFFNHRQDKWGGSAENRFRMLKEVVLQSKRALPEGFPVLVKLNSHDYTPQEGITPPLAAQYARWLVELGIDGLEVSCGTLTYSSMKVCQGELPANEMAKILPKWLRPSGKLIIQRMIRECKLHEGYNLEASRMIKSVIGDTPVIAVGGLRRVAQMEEALQGRCADLISMSRPFIREPFLVKQIRGGSTDKVACVSCNRCLAAIPNKLPVYCYNKRFPK